ncbi:unnamed protein product, partial [marine sediment metagenome]
KYIGTGVSREVLVNRKLGICLKKVRSKGARSLHALIPEIVVLDKVRDIRDDGIVLPQLKHIAVDNIGRVTNIAVDYIEGTSWEELGIAERKKLES